MDATEPTIGADAGELASIPGLLTDLALSLVPRRIAVATALLTLLGAYSRDKVQTLLSEVKRWHAQVARHNAGANGVCSVADTFDAGRNLLAAVSKLESSIMSLVAARVRVGLSPVTGRAPAARLEG